MFVLCIINGSNQKTSFKAQRTSGQTATGSLLPLYWIIKNPKSISNFKSNPLVSYMVKRMFFACFIAHRWDWSCSWSGEMISYWCFSVFFWCFKAVLRQFGGGGYGGSDTVITDEEELHRHQKLEKLYISTRSAKVYFSPAWTILLSCYCFTEVYFFVFSAFSTGHCSWCWRIHRHRIQTSRNR